METVTESQPGTILNPSGNSNPNGVSGTPGQETQVSSNGMYTQEQVDKLVDAAVHAAKSDSGREIANLKTQVNNLMLERDNLSVDIQDKDSEIAVIEKKLEDMASNDPARFDVVKELKQLRQDRVNLKSDYRKKSNELVMKENELQPKWEKVTAYETDILCEEIADTEVYEGADVKKLRDFCKRQGITSEKDIRDVADTLWVKKVNPNQANPVHQQTRTAGNPPPFPGHTGGGSGGRKPTVEELKASHPDETAKKIASGEWIL